MLSLDQFCLEVDYNWVFKHTFFFFFCIHYWDSNIILEVYSIFEKGLDDLEDYWIIEWLTQGINIFN